MMTVSTEMIGNMPGPARWIAAVAHAADGMLHRASHTAGCA
jgi:hypothetical protein